ncbi:MFS-type transporter SLC18B1 [Halotydeus destructor]|nr:MFS-type transporter SLC18B1 [Halotydeus destructor]
MVVETNTTLLSPADSVGDAEKTAGLVDTKTSGMASLQFEKVVHKNRKLKLIMLAMMNGCLTMAFSIMAPFFPREAERKGLSPSVAGIIFAAQPFFIAVASPWVGVLLPKYGSRMLIVPFMGVAGVCIITFGTMTYVDQSNLFAILCFTVRSVGAIAAAFVFTANFTVQCQLFPDNIGFAVAMGETMTGLGVSVGPAFGGVLFSLGGFGLPFYFVGSIVLLAMPVIWFMLDSPEFGPPTVIKAESKSTLSKWTAIRIPIVVITLITLTTCSLSMTFLEPNFEPHVRKFDLTPSQVGMVFFLGSLAYGILSPISGYISDKAKHNYFQLIIGQLIVGIAYLFMGPSPITGTSQSLLSDIMSQVCVCMGTAAAMIPTLKMLLTAMTDLGAPNDSSTYSFAAGLFSFGFNSGSVLGTSGGGFLVENFGFVASATVVAILNFISVTLLTGAYINYRCRPKKNVKEEKLEK